MICDKIQILIDYALRYGLITPEDIYVVRNRFMEVFSLTDWQVSGGISSGGSGIDEILDSLTDYACAEGMIPDTANSRDLFDTRLMGILTPMPHEVNSGFRMRYADSPESATDWYYDLSKRLNYVRAGRIAKDLKWKYASDFGELDITINLSKPEKDPRDIAAAREQKKTSYPLCQLCAENAGFAGTLTHPARQNLRPVEMNVNGERWQMQYSPYGYFNEHCIVFNEQHVPMKIDHAVFDKLFDITDKLPHYFVGSNADLPIVGGSILSHEHFQGGRYTFAMAKAPVIKSFEMKGHPDVKAGIVRWPMSVIRLASEDRTALSAACALVLDCWRGYSDPECGIYAETSGTPHNTITPIARMNGGSYECDLVLRNNITTDERPMGVFHPGAGLHHIKKENIGLIEVMGLAVLPSRLAVELKRLEEVLLRGDDPAADKLTSHHAEWAGDIIARHTDFCAENAAGIIRAEVGAVFEQVLKDCGVYKCDPAGRSGFERFISFLNDNT